ncbi:hypothetical protein CLU79DRAFT_722393 [Phycomyces nitens]|nr:hypothetical protein CLU79DRAFT_722393 [Phycomyces nitens]
MVALVSNPITHESKLQSANPLKVEAPVTPKETEKEDKQTIVPAPIPTVNVWQVNKPTETAQANENENPGKEQAWPAPQQVIEEASEKKEKFGIVKVVKDRGQWKPYTPTIIHASPATRTRSVRGRGASGADNRKDRKRLSTQTSSDDTDETETEIEKSETEKAKLVTPGAVTPLATSSTPIRTAYRGRGRGRGRGSGRYVPFGHHASQAKPRFANVDADTLKTYILQQIEYYFSIDNLCRDIFLRSQMDAQGYVDLQLLANFNRVKGLTTDMALIRESIQSSTLLDVSSDKIRRKEGWQTWLIQPTPTNSTTVVTKEIAN